MIVNREHHYAGPAYADLLHDANMARWSLQSAQATRTAKDGVPTGVAIAIRKTVGKSEVHAMSDHPPRRPPGKLAITWLQVGSDIGILVASIYLYRSEASQVQSSNCRSTR